MISQAAIVHRNIVGTVLAGLLLSACAAKQPVIHGAPTAGGSAEAVPRYEQTSRRLTVGERAAVTAVRQLGVPYRYGGTTPDGFDCSGLVHYAYAKAGMSIPRTTRNQWRNLQPVAATNLEVGDLLFFNIGGSISHVGLYLGSRRFVHAPSSGRDVTIEELDAGFYRRALVRGGRP